MFTLTYATFAIGFACCACALVRTRKRESDAMKVLFVVGATLALWSLILLLAERIQSISVSVAVSHCPQTALFNRTEQG